MLTTDFTENAETTQTRVKYQDAGRLIFLHHDNLDQIVDCQPVFRVFSIKGRATADKGPFSATGAWVWRWKDRIDREFMDRFEDLPALMSPVKPHRVPELPGDDQPHCGGCGAKVGGDALSRVLRSLAAEYPEHCLTGGDDASPVPVAAGSDTVLQSLDMLRQLVEDPWLMGRIAANHALSDLYACGARPVSALAAVNLPFSSPQIQRERCALLR